MADLGQDVSVAVAALLTLTTLAAYFKLIFFGVCFAVLGGSGQAPMGRIGFGEA